jgi:hypothetical protein
MVFPRQQASGESKQGDPYHGKVRPNRPKYKRASAMLFSVAEIE